MKNIKLNIPVLVQNLEVNSIPNYHIKSIFLPYPVATNRSFDWAIRQFQKEIRYYFKGFVLNEATANTLLWFMFNPELEFKHIKYSNTIKSQFVEGLITALAFDLQNQTFVCLPNFSYYIFIAQKGEDRKVNLEAEVQRVVTHLFKKAKEQYGRDLDLTPYFSNKKEFLSTVDISVNVQYDGFKFEKDPSQLFFSRLSANNDFEGAVEIEKVAENLNDLYPNELQEAFLQDALVQRIYEIIYSKENTPIVLIGKTGVGKHTLIHEVIRSFLNTKKEHGHRAQIWLLDPTRVISGMSIVGWWQKRLESIIKFLQKPHPVHTQSDKLLIDNPIALLRIGKSAQNNMTMAALLKPYIEKRQLQTILLASPEEWKTIQEEDRRFSDLFQVIRIGEADIETTTKIILQKRKKLESDNNCEISIKAIEQLLSIQRNFLKHEALPGSILKLLEKLSVKYRFKTIDAEEVRNEFQDISGLNTEIFDVSHQFEKDQVRNEIAKKLIGQEAAVDALANVIHLIKSKLSDPNKPNASFLFIGPTGVGKTQAAKVLAQYILGSEDYLMRFDMNEYIDEYSVQRLIGDLHNPEGMLTGKVRYRPFGIVLLDEIEKAHSKVHDILLQVLDDGRLTDSNARTVDFTNTIIIMTSNVGAEKAAHPLGYDTQSQNQNDVYKKAVEQKFRPEFVNRIDKIVIFDPLQLQHIYDIARLQIKELLQRDGFVRRTTILNISKEALRWVARRGFDAKMGGRALKRQIEQDLTALSADQLISTNFDRPIILEIKIEHERLVPHIEPLDFVEALPSDWLPKLPNERKGRRFFQSLITQLERIEFSIKKTFNTSENNIVDASNWQFYAFKDKITATKQSIQTKMLGFRDNNFTEQPYIPLRFKSSEFIPRSNKYDRAYRENMKDRLFQKEALEELSQTHQLASSKFDSFQTEFLDSFIDVQFIKLFAKDFLKNKIDHVTMYFESYIDGSGEKEIELLLHFYESFFNHLDLEYELDPINQTISSKGYALLNLLQGEAGIHLFYQSHQNPLPIKLLLNKKSEMNKGAFQVVRIYDSETTMMDLRTQFSNEVHIRYPELKVLLYAGFSSKK